MAETIQSAICHEIANLTGKTEQSQNFFDDPIVANAIRDISIYLSGNIGLDPNRTISAQAAEARNEGLKWGIEVCSILDSIDPDHCTKALNNERIERGTSKPYDAGNLVGTWQLTPDMAQQVYLLFENFIARWGFLPQIISGFRSKQYQDRLRQEWITAKREGRAVGYPPAVDSPHTRGMAVDLSTHNLSQDQLFWLARQWKSQDMRNRWGGDFTDPDKNHFDRK